MVAGGVPHARRAHRALAFGLSECLLAALTLWCLARLVRGVVGVARRKARPMPALGAGLWFALRIALLIGAGFYLTWGLNYARAPLPQRAQWDLQRNLPADRAGQARELGDLCERYVTLCNEAYREAHGSDDLGAPSRWPGSETELDQLIESALDSAGYELGLEATFLSRGAPVKRLLISPLMSRLFVSGFFFPWTGEANINGEQPGHALPHVIAHEKCHQRGIAREDEAEFLAFVAGTRATHPYLRYCAYSYAQSVLLRELIRLDGPRSQQLRNARLPGVRRDDDGEAQFWEQRRSKVSEVAVSINHTYLRSQGIKEGVHNYGAAARLIVGWARQRG